MTLSCGLKSVIPLNSFPPLDSFPSHWDESKSFLVIPAWLPIPPWPHFLQLCCMFALFQPTEQSSSSCLYPLPSDSSQISNFLQAWTQKSPAPWDPHWPSTPGTSMTTFSPILPVFFPCWSFFFFFPLALLTVYTACNMYHLSHPLSVLPTRT